MARVITSEIRDLYPVQPRQPSAMAHQARTTDVDKFGKVLGAIGGVSDIVGSPLVGSLVSLADEKYQQYKKDAARAEAEKALLEKTQAEYDTRARDEAASIQAEKDVRAQTRARLEAVGGVGAQLEQLGRDKRELEQWMLDHPEETKPTKGGVKYGVTTPAQQKYNALVAEEARLRMGLEKGGEPRDTAGAKAIELMKPRYGGAIEPVGGTQERDTTFPQYSDKVPQIQQYARLLDKMEKDPEAYPSTPEQRRELRDRISVMQRSLAADQLAAAPAQQMAAQAEKTVSLQAAQQRTAAESGSDTEAMLAALRNLPASTPTAAAPAAAKPTVSPAVDLEGMPLDELGAELDRANQSGDRAKAKQLGDEVLRRESVGSFAPSSKTGATSSQTLALAQQTGERGEEARAEMESAIANMKNALQYAGLSGDAAQKKAQELVAQAYARQDADNQKFMQATERFMPKAPEAYVDESGKAQLKKQDYEPARLEDVAKLARLADTKEKQARVYEILQTVTLPAKSVYDRFDPNRYTRVAQEVEKLFPQAKKSMLEESASLAEKFARTQGVYANISKGQQGVAVQAAGKQLQASKEEQDIADKQAKLALAIDKLEESKRAAQARDQAIRAAGSQRNIPPATAPQVPPERQAEDDVNAAVADRKRLEAEAGKTIKVVPNPASLGNPSDTHSQAYKLEKQTPGKLAEMQAEYDTYRQALAEKKKAEAALPAAKQAEKDAIERQRQFRKSAEEELRAIREGKNKKSGPSKKEAPGPAVPTLNGKPLVEGQEYESNGKTYRFTGGKSVRIK